jgi:hypothetical protein
MKKFVVILLNILHRCCGNKGCCIIQHNLHNMDQIKKDFEKNINTGLECCVCYNNTAKMTICNHLLCNSCKTQLTKKECPYCRNEKF